jgi:hypothetical protein
MQDQYFHSHNFMVCRETTRHLPAHSLHITHQNRIAVNRNANKAYLGIHFFFKYETVSLYNWFLTFWDNMVISSSRVKMAKNVVELVNAGIYIDHWTRVANFMFMAPCSVNVFKQIQQEVTLHNGIYYYKHRIRSRNLCTFFFVLAAEKSGCVKYADFFFFVEVLIWVLFWYSSSSAKLITFNCTMLYNYYSSFPSWNFNTSTH